MAADKQLEKLRKETGSKSATITLQTEDHLWLPSRVLALNWLTGGGFPYGTVVEVFGPESSGKSLMALDFAISTQMLGGIVLWGDAEFNFEDSRDFYESNGLDLDKVELLEDDAIEVTEEWFKGMAKYYRAKLTKNEPIVFIVDSLAAWECQDFQAGGKREGKKQMGNRASAIYQFYRANRKVMKKYGIITIVINQVRDKVGASMFEDNTTTPGGKATAFYASIRLAILKGKKIKDGERTVGNMIHTFVKKNKVSIPRAKVIPQFHFRDDLQGYIGFNRTAGLFNILKSEGLIKKKKGEGGGKYKLGDLVLAGSEESTDELLAEDETARKAVIKALNINTISKTRAKIAGLKRNLYPVKKDKKDSDE